jgi:hypothetical protein
MEPHRNRVLIGTKGEMAIGTTREVISVRVAPDSVPLDVDGVTVCFPERHG